MVNDIIDIAAHAYYEHVPQVAANNVRKPPSRRHVERHSAHQSVAAVLRIVRSQSSLTSRKADADWPHQVARYRDGTITNIRSRDARRID